jgi:hypothetical protein
VVVSSPWPCPKATLVAAASKMLRNSFFIIVLLGPRAPRNFLPAL